MQRGFKYKSSVLYKSGRLKNDILKFYPRNKWGFGYWSNKMRGVFK